jgi:hypothetical protein
MRLTRPTRAAGRERPRNYHGFLNRDITAAPIRSCSRWGLPCRPCCQRRGALLPHRFALACGVGSLTQAGLAQAVCFLWHFPWGHPRRPLAGTVFPWSPDFPPPAGLPHRRRPPSCLASGMCAPATRRSSTACGAGERPLGNRPVVARRPRNGLLTRATLTEFGDSGMARSGDRPISKPPAHSAGSAPSASS